MFASCHTRMTTLSTTLQMKGHRRRLETKFRSKIQNQCPILNVTGMILTLLSRVFWPKPSTAAALASQFIHNVTKSLRYDPLHFAQANVLGKSCEWRYCVLRSLNSLSKSVSPCGA